jgi:hypothetical protein
MALSPPTAVFAQHASDDPLATAGEVRIIGSHLAAEGVGTTAFGQPHNQETINANYKSPWLPALSADITLQHFGTSPASVDDVTQNPAQTVYFAYLATDFS